MDRKKMCLVLAVIFALNIAAILLVERADAASYKKGSTGSAVKQIQTVLKNQGFYSGPADGVFGSATEKAVKAYQKNMDLRSTEKLGRKR